MLVTNCSLAAALAPSSRWTRRCTSWGAIEYIYASKKYCIVTGSYRLNTRWVSCLFVIIVRISWLITTQILISYIFFKLFGGSKQWLLKWSCYLNIIFMSRKNLVKNIISRLCDGRQMKRSRRVQLVGVKIEERRPFELYCKLDKIKYFVWSSHTTIRSLEHISKYLHKSNISP